MVCEVCLPTWMEKGINNGCMLCRGRITEIILGDGAKIPMELPNYLNDSQYHQEEELNEQKDLLYQTYPGVENNNDILTEATELINTETKKDNPCCCAIL